MQLTVEFHFAAAHRLPFYDGPCNRMHGHNYKLFVTVTGPVDPHSGMVIDFVTIRDLVEKKIFAKADHRCFNDFLENPTAELIAKWAWDELEPALPGMSEVRLFETDDCMVTYRGEGLA